MRRLTEACSAFLSHTKQCLCSSLQTFTSSSLVLAVSNLDFLSKTPGLLSGLALNFISNRLRAPTMGNNKQVQHVVWLAVRFPQQTSILTVLGQIQQADHLRHPC